MLLCKKNKTKNNNYFVVCANKGLFFFTTHLEVCTSLKSGAKVCTANRDAVFLHIFTLT